MQFTTRPPDTPSVLALAALLDKLARARPLVHNITNFVAMDISANVLLAMGASPAMVSAPEEAAEFAGRADALAVNIGTLSAPGLEAMLGAARVMRGAGKPWVLDPVGVGATKFRDEAALALLALSPTIIRANASEILALARLAGVGASNAAPRGVDSRHQTSQAEDAALALARRFACVVAVTGEVDFLTDGARRAHIANGSPMMPLVTALGCALSALTAAFAAVSKDAFAAAAAALIAYGVAGEMAEEAAEGPGSFRMVFLDMLHALSAEDMALKARFSA